MEGGIQLSIRIDRNPQKLVRLHPTYRALLVGAPNTSVPYNLGPRRGEVPVIFDPQVHQDEIVVTSHFAYELGIRHFVEAVHVRLDENHIRFATIVGIMCTPRWSDKLQTLKPSKQLPVLQKLLEVGDRENVLCFVFSVRDVDVQRATVKGYRVRNGKFVADRFPLPNVIYDQVVSRKQERSPQNLKTHEFLREVYGERLFNPGFLDKWQVYQWLQEDKRTIPFIPATVRYTSIGEAGKFIQQHPVTYCKPVHGSLGLGIFKIERKPEGGYTYQIRKRAGPPIQGTGSSPADVLGHLKKRLTSKPYLLQQGISLIQLDGRPFDIRIVMQRDGQGTWKRTKMFARLAERGQITSNLSTGGEAASFSDVIEPLFSTASQRQKVIRDVRRVSRLVPEVIEAQSHERFGELGIDIGVDYQGGVWIIEVNSKPWKTTTTDKGRQDLVDLAFERPIRYAKYLAQQPQ